MTRKAAAAAVSGLPPAGPELRCRPDRRHGSGVLGQERQALSAIALCQWRPGPEAQARVAKFLRNAPESPLADVDFFDALVAQLEANYCMDAGRIFAMGHGDGAIIANQLACLRGNILRGVGPFGGAGPADRAGASCTGKVAALVGHNPNEGDAVQCGKVTGGSCPWTLLWADTGWPTTQYWARQNGCSDPGAMPTTPFAGNGTTGNPLPCPIPLRV
jgi:poly(3-hydroxybutyrate) depolymerase